MPFSENNFINGLIQISYQSGSTAFYTDGLTISSRCENSRFKKIPPDEIGKKVIAYVNNFSFGGAETMDISQQIRCHEKIKHLLSKIHTHEKKAILNFLKRPTAIKQALEAINLQLSDVCSKKTFPTIETPHVAINPEQHSVTKTILSAYNLDFDRAEEYVPNLLGQLSLESLIDTITDMEKILISCQEFDEHEKYITKEVLFELSQLSNTWLELYTASPEKIEKILARLLNGIDTPEGIIIPGFFDEHFVIISITPQDNNKYRFSITNAGEGILKFHNQRMESGLLFETTQTFSDLSKEKVSDISFLSQLVNRLPAGQAYQVITKHLEGSGDSNSQDRHDFRKPQMRSTCAARTIQKWTHQKFYENGCEVAYRRIRCERSLLIKKRLESISLEALEPYEMENIVKQILPNSLEGKEINLKNTVKSMVTEQKRTIERRKKKLRALIKESN